MHRTWRSRSRIFRHGLFCRPNTPSFRVACTSHGAAISPALRIVQHFTATAGRLSPALLSQAVPDLAERSTWLCGPSAWMDDMHRYWLVSGFQLPLLSERFAAAPVLPAQALGEPVSITFQASGKQFTTQGSAALLMQAEQHGLSPKHGCRIGICRSCQCIKTSGTVQNLQTGELCDAPNTPIRMCISAARSDVTLAL